jgi:hypothetical protein
VVKVELPLLSPAASDIAPPADEEEPEMDSVEKEEELDDTNRYLPVPPLGVACVADPDPDPPDPHVFGPPGSGYGSISQR